MQNINIIITGIGGQGIILASDVLAQAAIWDGYDVKKTDSIGMAQRGGSVISHVRLGESVYSPLIPQGEADILFGMEKLEAVRSCLFLKKDGSVLLNQYGSPPLSLIGGEHQYPDDEAILKCMHEQAGKVFVIDGFARVADLGNVKTLNVFLLGALSVLLPLTRDAWLKSLEYKLSSRVLEINLKAFALGEQEMPDARLV